MASASAVEILGEERIEHGMAILFSGYGLGNLVSPIISGKLFISFQVSCQEIVL